MFYYPLLFIFLFALPQTCLTSTKNGGQLLADCSSGKQSQQQFLLLNGFFVGSPVADLSSGLGSKQDDTSSFISSFLLLHRPTQIFCVKSVFCLDIHDFLLPLWILTLSLHTYENKGDDHRLKKLLADQTNSLCQHLSKFTESSIESMHTDIRV